MNILMIALTILFFWFLYITIGYWAFKNYPDKIFRTLIIITGLLLTLLFALIPFLN